MHLPIIDAQRLRLVVRFGLFEIDATDPHPGVGFVLVDFDA
jgi:hypothetical protein